MPPLIAHVPFKISLPLSDGLDPTKFIQKTKPSGSNEIRTISNIGNDFLIPTTPSYLYRFAGQSDWLTTSRISTSSFPYTSRIAYDGISTLIGVGANDSGTSPTVNNVVISFDGGWTWAQRSVNLSANWRNVAYDPVNGVWLIVSEVGGSNQMRASLDGGYTWITRNGTGKLNTSHLAYGNGILLQLLTRTFGISTNGGVSWTTSTLPLSSEYVFGTSTNVKMYFLNGLFIVSCSNTGSTPTGFLVSPNGTNWTFCPIEGAPSVGIAFRDIAYGNGIFIAVSGSASAGGYAYSLDGYTWKVKGYPSQVTQIPNMVGYANKEFLFANQAATSLYYSYRF